MLEREDFKKFFVVTQIVAPRVVVVLNYIISSYII